MSHYYFWLHHQLHPESPACNIPAVFRIEGPLDIPALRQSIDTVLERHEVFSTVFSPQGDPLLPQDREQVRANLEQVALGEASADTDSLHRWIREEIARPFNLRTGPLIRINLLHLEAERHILLLVMHHSITDLRSKELLGAQISVCYDTLIKKRNLPLLEPPCQYSDFVRRQQAWRSSAAAAAMIGFWKKEIEEHGGSLPLPLDYRRPPVAGSQGAAHLFAIDPRECSRFHEFCRRHSIAPFVALLTCYLIILARYSGQRNLVVGVPLTNRRQDMDKDTLGCFLNTLPLAVDLHKDLTVLQAMKLVRWKLLQAHRNQETPFHDIVTAAQLPREPSYNPLFQVGFTHEPPMELPLAGVRVVSEKWHNQGALLDLFLNIFEMTPAVRGYFEYNQDLFSPATVARLSDHYRQLVISLPDRAEETVSTVEILRAEERQRLLLQWNRTACDYGEEQCSHLLCEAQAVRTPDAIAVADVETALTYREFNARANRLAHYLQAHGVGPERMVGVFMERSPEMVIALHAILKAGGAYVPLDPDFPEDRLAFILGETEAGVVLTQHRLRPQLPSFAGTILALDSEWGQVAAFPDENPACPASLANLAYVLYTSGSTGRPKGVMIEHRGLCNRLRWMQATFPLGPEDRVLQKTPFSFDVSVWEFFWPFLAGARLVVPPPNAHKDPVRLRQLIEHHAITTLHFVPSMLRLFLDAAEPSCCPSLRRVFCSGEAMTWELQEAFFAKFTCELHNLYGPTEATIDVSHWDCGQRTHPGKVPIGDPVANTQLYILDENRQPVPEGAAGELYIGGVQVARGYLQRPELNATAFIPDPFRPEDGGRLYRTGDRARYLPDGAIEYLGRADFQIKIFGNRIEPAEIEAVLAAHSMVRDAVVTCYAEPGGRQQLVAYILSEAATLDELAPVPFLRERLPYFMIPSQFILLREFPLTGSGKINRKGLPPPGLSITAPDLVRKESNYLLLVRSVWKKVLDSGTPPDDRNFFDAGGNSLLATRVTFELSEILGQDIPLVKIFQYPTIAGLSEFLARRHRPAPGGADAQRARIHKRHLALTRLNHRS